MSPTLERVGMWILYCCAIRTLFNFLSHCYSSDGTDRISDDRILKSYRTLAQRFSGFVQRAFFWFEPPEVPGAVAPVGWVFACIFHREQTDLGISVSPQTPQTHHQLRRTCRLKKEVAVTSHSPLPGCPGLPLCISNMNVFINPDLLRLWFCLPIPL